MQNSHHIPQPPAIPRRLFVVVSILLALILFAVVSVYAAPGDLDTTFAENGQLVRDFNGNDAALAMMLQADDKVVAVGYTNGASDAAVFRFLPDGTFDPEFGEDGMVTTDAGTSYDTGRAVVIQEDGKIVVAGHTSTDALLIRYDPDGSLDSSFGNNGLVMTSLGIRTVAWGLALQDDGKIVVTGDVADDDTNDYEVFWTCPALVDTQLCD